MKNSRFKFGDLGNMEHSISNTQFPIFIGIANSLEIEWSSKITEGGFSPVPRSLTGVVGYPPWKEYRGLENPRSVEEAKHRDYYETISNFLKDLDIPGRVTFLMRYFLTVLVFFAAFCSGNVAFAEESKTKQDPQYRKAFDESVDKALAFIAKSQLPDGSFPGGMPKNTAITSLCVMAYLARGYSPGLAPYGETIDRGIDFVLSAQAADGTLVGAGGGQMYSHNISTLMLSEVSGMLVPDRQKKVDIALGKALKIILDAQRIQKPDAHRGGWRYEKNSGDSDLSHSGWALMALRSARNNGAPVPKEAIDDAISFILKCRTQDGGFAYQPGGGASITQTGVGLLCLELCGHHREEATIKAGEYISTRYDVNKTNEIPFFYYSHYYFAQGMFQLGDEQWEKFAPKIYETLLKLQKEDGSWPPIGQHETGPGPCYATAMAVLALSVTYHQLPIYQR